MTDLLFVYGTLMRSAATAAMGGPERQRLWSESRLVGPATISAILYDFGAYPGLVPAPAGSGRIVHGEVLRLDDAAATFNWLDIYEMIVPGDDTASEYARVTAAVSVDGTVDGALAAAAPTTAWTYVIRRDFAAMAPIAAGRWLPSADR